MESLLGGKGEQELGCRIACHPPANTHFTPRFAYFFTFPFHLTSKCNESMGKKETGNEVLL